jgi:hypothetical protein
MSPIDLLSPAEELPFSVNGAALRPTGVPCCRRRDKELGKFDLREFWHGGVGLLADLRERPLGTGQRGMPINDLSPLLTLAPL